MSAAYSKLRGLLNDLFQFDQADLDFGIYRILHARKAEINGFMDRDLLPRVRAAFAQMKATDYSDHQGELTKAITAAKNLGVDPESTTKVKELRAKLASQPDLTRLEYETYDHLWRFFSRYYSEGDFMSKRVYRDGVYAIPYDGSEVVLHWANKDQYYIKTSEYLRDYVFRLRPDNAARPMRVHFRLVDAQEGFHNNVKAGDDQSRVFILAPGGASGRDFLVIDGDDLVIRFEYRVAVLADGKTGEKKPPKQRDLAAKAIEQILGVTGDENLAPWIEALSVLAPTENDPHRSVLAKHLDQYVKRNTFDYFIHKDLGAFLRRELDHYLKTEVMRLDDIDHADAPQAEQYLATVKVIRQIARAIIDFLAQVEDFQKKLWLKKKFVTGCRRLVRLDMVPDRLLPQVCVNAAQLEQWVRLHAIDKIERSTVAEGYSDPLTPAFLRQHPSLMVDTGCFDNAFSESLCEHLGDLDSVTDGIVLHSENFQALNLVHQRFSDQLKCIYIDPPYNAKTSEILYRNTFKHSSWISFMQDRILKAKSLLGADSVFVCAIDENEQENLGILLRQSFPESNYDITCISVVHNPRGIQGKGISHTHESSYVIAPRGHVAGLRALEDEKSKPLMKTGSESERNTGKNCFYPILVKDNSIIGFGSVPDDGYHPPGAAVLDSGVLSLWPISTDGTERKWRYARQSIEDVKDQLSLRPGRDGSPVVYLGKSAESYRSVWQDAEFNAAEYGSTLLKNIIGNDIFSFPKSIWTVWHSLTVARVGDGDWSLDFFAGSGTTAHAVINLNRADGGRRKFILTEMAGYCETALIPRIQKITYTPAWKDGRPERLATTEEATRGPRVVLLQNLESYEDTLNNLNLRRDQAVQQRLDDPVTSAAFRDQYLLRYHLDLESRGSASLLNASAFLDPMAYRLSVTVPGSDERRLVTVDLIETFTWLLGLRVHSQRARQVVSATMERQTDDDLPADAPRRLVVVGALRPDPAGPWWFKPIEGVDPEGRRVLVIWRNRPGGDIAEGMERDNAVLNAWVVAQGYAARDFHRIYVNGDNQIENLRQVDQTWTVRLIDTDFAALMFAGTEGGV